MPVGLLWLGLGVASFWAFRRGLRVLSGFVMCLFLGLGLAGNPQVGAWLMGRLESPIPSLPVEAAPLDALFILGGGSEVDAHGHAMVGMGGDRIVEAARLWHAGRAKRLVASGASNDSLAARRNLAVETRAIWLDLGVPASAILCLEEPCFVTRDEIKAYAHLKAREGWQRVGLLSSAWHLPRAMALAKQEELEVVPVPSDRRGRMPRFQLWHLIPQQEGFQKTQLACWEMLGRRVGR